jgi:hypothetical protein
MSGSENGLPPIVSSLTPMPGRHDATRRSAVLAGLGLSAAALLVSTKQAAAATSDAAYQNLISNGGDPTGKLDSTPAFTAAFSKLPASGGTIYCEGGVYALQSAVVFTNKPVQIVGDGSAATVFVMQHTGVAFTFTSTAGYASYYPFSMTGVSIQGPVGQGTPPAAGAIALYFPGVTSETGYSSCNLDDISIGNSLQNGSSGSNILTGLFLQNIWKSHISNVRMFGPFYTSGTFINLNASPSGASIDNWFVNCSSDGPQDGFVVSGVSQGIHLVNALILAGTGFTTQFTNQGNNNVTGLFISGCYFDTNVAGAVFSKVAQGWVSDSYFGCSVTAPAVIVVDQCAFMHFSNLHLGGAYPGSPNSASMFGMNIQGAANHLNGIVMTELANGIQYISGSAANLALGLQLISQPNYPRLQTGPAAVDNSGNNSFGVNNAQWMTDNGQLHTLY